jgi:copper chaperone CopZ
MKRPKENRTMKSSFGCISVLGVMLAAGCSTARGPVTTGKATETATYTVYGMDCPGCHGGVEKNLKKIPGVIDARANWKQKTVTLMLDPEQRVDDEAVKEAVEDSNFTLGVTPAPGGIQ